MRTYDFNKFNNDPNGKFLPVETFESEYFGRHFFLDSELEFISAPSFKSGGYDESQLDYVGNWTDLEGVNLNKLLDIYKVLVKMRLVEELEFTNS
tara:strand:+ start:192 stop:476 length:285 start_codon:yes stop_codon:yes gene_type:complete